ncbi:hypothetical protein C8Q74DRAFT_18766 [Fomes fomentarius]|nr:hypothetical protein C8Q74DRAFT_18766 [Fomes fomentarius]
MDCSGLVNSSWMHAISAMHIHVYALHVTHRYAYRVMRGVSTCILASVETFAGTLLMGALSMVVLGMVYALMVAMRSTWMCRGSPSPWTMVGWLCG